MLLASAALGLSPQSWYNDTTTPTLASLTPAVAHRENLFFDGPGAATTRGLLQPTAHERPSNAAVDTAHQLPSNVAADTAHHLPGAAATDATRQLPDDAATLSTPALLTHAARTEQWCPGRTCSDGTDFLQPEFDSLRLTRL